jgi:alkylhydroperoxidase/carboxymuconolactone decarboxylase family protein YurZ
VNEDQQDWNFPFEEPLHEVFPQLHAAQNAYMAQLDSLSAPDRKTHELIRLAVTVGIRSHEGVRRHARLAREVGASWEDILGSIMLTVPGHGLSSAVEAIPHARKGYEEAREAEQE